MIGLTGCLDIHTMIVMILRMMMMRRRILIMMIITMMARIRLRVDDWVDKGD